MIDICFGYKINRFSQEHINYIKINLFSRQNQMYIIYFRYNNYPFKFCNTRYHWRQQSIRQFFFIYFGFYLRQNLIQTQESFFETGWQIMPKSQFYQEIYNKHSILYFISFMEFKNLILINSYKALHYKYPLQTNKIRLSKLFRNSNFFLIHSNNLIIIKLFYMYLSLVQKGKTSQNNNYKKDQKQSILFSQNVQLTGHQAEILCNKFSPDGKVLATAGMDKQILLWRAYGLCENFSVLKAHTNAIISLCFQHTGQRLYSASADKSLIVWDIQEGKILKKYKSHTSIVQSVTAPKRLMDLMGSASDDGFVKIWDTRQKKLTHQFSNKYPMTSVCFSQIGDKIFAGGIDNQIKCFNLKTGKVEYTLDGHLDTISCLSLSHDGSYLLSNSFDENIRVWDVRSFVSGNTRLLKVFSGHNQGNEKSLLKGGWSYDGLYIGCGSADKCIYIWDTTTRKIVQKLGGHIGTVNEIAFNPKSNMLASCSNDKTIILTQLPDIFL